MNIEPRKITLEEWDARYEQMRRDGLSEPDYVGPISRHLQDRFYRLSKLKYDNSLASLRLWNFLLTEEQRLYEARDRGIKIVGTMKDLGTIPVMVYSLDNLVAFYPDSAWWMPCLTELDTELFWSADSVGINESFCPVRSMFAIFLLGKYFPVPDELICSVGATCDDFSVIAQRLNNLGYPITWWEIPHRRHPEPNEQSVKLPGGFSAPKSLVEFVKSELEMVKDSLEDLAGCCLTDDKLSRGIKRANEFRKCLAELRQITFTAGLCPLGSLEMLMAEMLAIHFCSNRNEAVNILKLLLEEVKKRVKVGKGVLSTDAVRIFWVNPVADLRVMNILEDCGGRVCGTEYLFSHALDAIPEQLPPIEALARTALADPMAGSSADRAYRICSDITRFGAEALLISRIPGASHCALEGRIIAEIIKSTLALPVLEIEIPTITDSMCSTLYTQLEALIEIVKERRNR